MKLHSLDKLASVLFLALTLTRFVAGQEAQPPATDETTKSAPAQQPQDPVDVDALINKAAANATAKQQFELKYQLTKGSEFRWSVEQTATTKTHMSNTTEEMASRSKSVKCWKVINVDSRGNMVFEHSIESVEMWQKVGDESAISYNSQTDSQPPQEYLAVSEKIGKPLATFTVSPGGKVVNRQSNYESAHFGVGEVVIPLPEKPIAIGYKWHVPTQFTAENEEGEIEQVSARIAYELDKVVDGKAYLVFRTEILTPLESEKVKSQLMQQINRGFAVFDLQRGLVVQREVEWNEKVQGFEGPDSYLQYLAKLTEKLVTDGAATKTAENPLAPKK